jgi:hypothetical protein
MIKLTLALLALSFLLVGCVVASSEDQRAKAAEFGGAKYDEAVIKAGKEKEREEAKKREEAYLAAGRDQGGEQSQEGPTNAPTGATTGN